MQQNEEITFTADVTFVPLYWEKYAHYFVLLRIKYEEIFLKDIYMYHTIFTGFII